MPHERLEVIDFNVERGDQANKRFLHLASSIVRFVRSFQMVRRVRCRLSPQFSQLQIRVTLVLLGLRGLHLLFFLRKSLGLNDRLLEYVLRLTRMILHSFSIHHLKSLHVLHWISRLLEQWMLS